MDHGGENYGVACFVEETNGSGCRSGISGHSVHNQRIDRLQVEANMCVITVFENTFIQLEESLLLDIYDDAQVFVLHHVYFPRVQPKLNLFCAQHY